VAVVEPAELVQQLGTERTLDAIRALMGGVNARELKDVKLTDPVLAALTAGVSDPNAKRRWWCIQLLDHVDDVRAVEVIARALDDPVPRVRRNAAHALGCVACKPAWDGGLPPGALKRLQEMADHDPNAKVRAQAAATLSCAAGLAATPT
jgi:HEAT repeat protein